MNCFSLPLQERLYPGVTTGEKIADNVAKCLEYVFVLPCFVVGSIILTPLYALTYSVDAIHHIAHVRKMNKNWMYRLETRAIRMSDLKIWQRDINAYDQHMRKMLAIAELNDLPFEVWGDLLYKTQETDFENGRIREIAQMFGIPELYTNDIKDETLEIAMLHYCQLYQQLHKIPEAKDADIIISDIIALEMVHHADNEPTIII
jgi:AraC-like DNA-binding protein